MEYQIINLLDNRSNQLHKFRTKNWIDDQSLINQEKCIIPIVILDLRPQC